MIWKQIDRNKAVRNIRQIQNYRRLRRAGYSAAEASVMRCWGEQRIAKAIEDYQRLIP